MHNPNTPSREVTPSYSWAGQMKILLGHRLNHQIGSTLLVDPTILAQSPYVFGMPESTPD